MSDRVQVQITNRAGAVQATITDPIACRYNDTQMDAADGGEGSFTIPIDHAEAGQVVPERIAKILVDGAIKAAFEIGTVDYERSSDDEHAGQLITASGEALGILFGTSEVGGGVVAPCGGVGAFTGDVRDFGWMDCCCFDHTRFTGSLGMCHRQSAPAPPFTRGEPEGWPDRNARRVFCAAPTEVQAGVNEVQEIKLGNSIVSGTFTLTFEGETTAPIASPWSAANVKAALEALANIDGVTVTGTGLDSDPFRVTFDVGNVAFRDVDMMGLDHSQLNHPPQTGSVTEVVKGKTGVYNHAPSCCYIHDTFTLDDDTDLVLFSSMSEVGEIRINGVTVHSQQSASSATSFSSTPITLPAGEHCITARVCKTSEDDGLGWIMWTLAKAAQDDEGVWDLAEVIHRSNCDMSALSTGVDDDPPGLNVGEIVLCLMGESQALGDLDGLTTSITTTHDSGGVPWADEFVWGVKIGTGLLDVIVSLCELSGSTFKVDDDLVLHIWQDRGTDRTGSVIFAEASDFTGGILLQAIQRRRKRASHLQIETQDGFDSANDPSITGPQRRLGVTMGTAPNIEGLAQFATFTFRDVGRERRTTAIQTWGPTGLIPHDSFDVCDNITAPGIAGTGVPWRVTAIQMIMDPDGAPIWAVMLEDLP